MKHKVEAALPWALIGAASLGMFACTSSGTTRAPFLIDMGHDLSVSMGLVANLVSLTATAWGVSSAIAGWLSDVMGRRLVLVGSLLGLALTLVGQALAGSFFWVAVWATVGGGFCGAFTAAAYAELSGRVPDRQRGRALGWVMAGQSLTLLVGVPMAAFIGAFIGWRGVMEVLAGLCITAMLSLLVTTLRPAPDAGGGRAAGRRASTASALTAPVIRLLAMGTVERVCFGLASVYFATFLQMT